MAVAAILVMWPGYLNKLSFPHPIEAPNEIWLIGHVVSEEKSVDDGRRTTEAYLSYKLTKWVFCSGELKRVVG